MSDTTPLRKSEIKEKLSQRLVLFEEQTPRSKTELTEEELGTIFGGTQPYAFEYEGKVWVYICKKQEAYLDRHLQYESACKQAPPGTPSCYQCEYLMFVRYGGEGE